MYVVCFLYQCLTPNVWYVVFQVFEGVYNNARMLHFLTAVVVCHLNLLYFLPCHGPLRHQYHTQAAASWRITIRKPVA